MNDRDPVDVDLDRYLDETEEDYKSPYELKRERDEYLADSMDYEEE